MKKLSIGLCTDLTKKVIVLLCAACFIVPDGNAMISKLRALQEKARVENEKIRPIVEDYLSRPGSEKIIIVGHNRGFPYEDKEKYLLVSEEESTEPGITCDVQNVEPRYFGGESKYDKIIFENLIACKVFTPEAITGALRLLKHGGKLISNGFVDGGWPIEMRPRDYIPYSPKRYYLNNTPGDSWYWEVADNKLATLALFTDNEKSQFYSWYNTDPSKTAAAEAIEVYTKYMDRFKAFFGKEANDMIENIEFKEVQAGTSDWPQKFGNSKRYVMIITRK
jgi:hypothetical protein